MILVLLVSSPIIGNAAHVLSWTFIGSEQVFPGNSSIYSQVKQFIEVTTTFLVEYLTRKPFEHEI